MHLNFSEMPCLYQPPNLCLGLRFSQKPASFTSGREKKIYILPADNTSVKSPRRTELLVPMVFLHKLPSAVNASLF